MQDFLRKAFNLGLGLVTVTKEKAEEVVNELIKKGEVSQEEGKKLVSELLEKGEKSREELEAQIEKITKGAVERLDLPTRKELNELKSEIEQLKEKLNNKE